MKRTFVSTVFFSAISATVCGQATYDAAGIPKSLLEEAAAVVRFEEQLFDVTSPVKAQMVYKFAVTILNKAGDRYAEMVEGYDQFSSISDINATIYDAAGKVIQSYKKSAIKDRSLISDFSIYEDNRIKHLTFANPTYPYTVEYGYTKVYNGFISIPSWRPVTSFGLAVEQSSYTIRCPDSYQFKKLTSAGLPMDSVKLNGKIDYKWACRNLPAMVYEPYSAGFDNLVPWVSASPRDFAYDGTRGSVATWSELAKWLFRLNEGGTVLPEQTKNEIRSLIKDTTTDEERIRILYDYLQKNTRYVSVQLGIGGFKPISADKVAQVKYGDCKALSNFMKALLQEAGIRSNLVVIGNGMPSLDAAYASFGQANHMILCVPMSTDTLFLECTSQFYPVGYIGHSNSNRQVLMVGNDEGKLIRTPKYAAADNYQRRNVKVHFADDLAANIDVTTVYGNAQFEPLLHVLLEEPSEQRKNILENLGIPGMELIDYSYLQMDRQRPELIEKISVASKQLLNKGGDRLFLTANLLNRRETVPPAVKDRKTHFAVSFDYLDEDEITYTLPAGYVVEHMPEAVQLDSEFGSYTASYTVSDRSIVYRRSQVMTSKKHPPEKYADFVTFCKGISQADKQKIVLIKSL